MQRRVQGAVPTFRAGGRACVERQSDPTATAQLPMMQGQELFIKPWKMVGLAAEGRICGGFCGEGRGCRGVDLFAVLAEMRRRHTPGR